MTQFKDGDTFMLDKSIPFVGLYMRREPGSRIPAYGLPDGFKFTYFKDGDEADWSRIESSVLEFDSEFSALMFFKEKYIPIIEELYRRCIFIETACGDKVATATAWWSSIYGERRPWLHWIGVCPEYQGLGLGKALISRVTELMTEIEGDVPIFLKTQTWSYKAINIYLQCGYEPTYEKLLYRDRSDNCKKALRVLKRKKKCEITKC